MEVGQAIAPASRKKRMDDDEEEEKYVAQGKSGSDDVSGGGKDDLLSESEVDLGEGSIADSDYPSSDYEEMYKESVKEYEEDMLRAEEKGKGSVIILSPLKTREQQALYDHVFSRSNGFEVPFFRHNFPDFGQYFPIRYRSLRAPESEEYVNYCRQAIEEYNKKKGTCYGFKYLIKICCSLYEYNITFALTDLTYQPYVGRVNVEFPCDPTLDPIVDAMIVTRGEYRVPRWKDVHGVEYKCEVNEEFRQNLPELEKEWRHKMHLD